MHVLANSVPDLNGAIRSHDLLVSLNDAGICEPVVLTSPYYPDRKLCDDVLLMELNTIAQHFSQRNLQ